MWWHRDPSCIKYLIGKGTRPENFTWEHDGGSSCQGGPILRQGLCALGREPEGALGCLGLVELEPGWLR